MSQPTLPNGWRWARLGQLCETIGGGTPSRTVERYYQGHIPWVTVKDMVEGVFTLDDAQEHITEEAIERSATHLIPAGSVIVATRVGLGKVTINSVPVAINQDLKALYCKGQIFVTYLLFAIHHYTWQFVKYGQGSTVKGVRQEDLLNLEIPLPPLPVQERIVEILQRADSICHKRQEALGLTDAILSSAFIEMFGDPRKNPQKFRVTPLGELADVRSGVTKGRKLRGKVTVEAPYLRVANVQDGYLDLSEIKNIEVLTEDIAKYHLEDGDILMTEGGDPDKLGRGCIYRNEVEGCIHQNHVFRVRTNQSRLAPEYLAALLRTQYAKEYFLRCAKRTSNLASINSTQVKAFPVPEPPLPLQLNFVSAVEQWEQINRRLTDGLTKSKSLFQGLLQQAFTGELTAAWEAEHAYEIAAQQARRERLPRLVLLDFVREHQRRRPRDPVLITSLMKYVFLLQKEGTTGQALYHFVPYKYGPFAKELYQDLQALVAEGFVAVTEGDDERTEISLIPSKEPTLQKALADLAENFRTNVTRILDQYGNLSHNQLLATVYERFPAYATKSRLQRRPSP